MADQVTPPPGYRMQEICALAGPGAIVVALVGWLVAGVLPRPPAADDSTADIVAFYGENPTAVRLGLALAVLGLSGIGALTAVISIRMVQMPGQSPVAAFLQMISGAVTWVMLIVPLVIMNVAAFRPDRTPELTVTLNDLAWILFIPPVGPFLVQNVAIAVGILSDRGERPILPRWVAFANLWVGFLFLPGLLAYFFKSGPFAWQGIFSFWLALTAYAAWAFIMGFTIRASLRREYAGSPAAPATVDA
ncbi:hypothetical protein [Pseudonocardia pini]|uniref:hypothetical protein n=1 Tax=Pseudonocardia pini TaxID=2758030 RepID=UPI0015F100E2|nr:hypothetical protein [Pseudonocardia pini]